MHQREKHFSKNSLPHNHNDNNSNGNSNGIMKAPEVIPIAGSSISIANVNSKNSKKKLSNGAFITGRSPGSINIFDSNLLSSSSTHSSTSHQSISVGSKHYKQLKAIQEGDGIVKPRQVGNNAHSMVKTDRAGLKNHAGEVKKRGIYLGKEDENGLDTPIFAMDKQDPNYDSQDEDDFAKDILRQEKNQRKLGSASAASVHYKPSNNPIKSLIETAPASSVANAKKLKELGNTALSTVRTGEVIGITLPNFKIRIVDLLTEYSISEDLEEFIRSLTDLQGSIWHFELVRRAISLAMERTPREREIISRLLSQLNQRKVLTTIQAEKGFERLFELADDIQLDVPQAKDYLARFLARCVADEVIPPSFLMDQFIVQLGGEIVEQAKVFLNMKHNSIRLEHIWGTSGNVLPVDELKEQIDLIIREYVISSDLSEALTCIRVLNVPHFHHEIVKRAIVIGMDHHEKEREMISQLLSSLCSNEILSKPQLLDGYSRCVKALQDLALDAPNAESVLRVFIMQSVADNNLSVQDAANLLA